MDSRIDTIAVWWLKRGPPSRSEKAALKKEMERRAEAEKRANLPFTGAELDPEKGGVLSRKSS